MKGGLYVIWLWLLLFVCAVVCVLLMQKLYREKQRQKALINRMRKSEIYGHLYPQLVRCNARHVETLIVRPSGLAIRFLQPVGDTLRCSFDALGFDDMDQVPLYALTQAIAADMPILQDKSHYRLLTHHEKHMDGEPWLWYEYAIQTRYKDQLMRTFTVHQPENTPYE